jgi:hypothetical protein
MESHEHWEKSDREFYFTVARVIEIGPDLQTATVQ